jgi:hypothetical protein
MQQLRKKRSTVNYFNIHHFIDFAFEINNSLLWTYQDLIILYLFHYRLMKMSKLKQFCSYLIKNYTIFCTFLIHLYMEPQVSFISSDKEFCFIFSFKIDLNVEFEIFQVKLDTLDLAGRVQNPPLYDDHIQAATFRRVPIIYIAFL